MRIDRLDFGAKRYRPPVDSRKNRKKQNFGVRKSATHLGNQRSVPQNDFVLAMKRQIICPNKHYSDFGIDSIELAVLNTPQDMLNSVPTDSEVQRLKRRDLFLPNFCTVIAPIVGDRVSKKKNLCRS